MFDNDINNSIRKGLRIGKWFIGTTIIINIATWVIIGFLAYKYIYIDHIASKFSGPEHEEEVIVEKFKVVHSFEKGLKKLLPDTLIADSSIGIIEDTKEFTKNFNNIRYSKLQKDELGRPILKICGSISDDFIDKMVNDLETLPVTKEFVDSKYDYLNKMTQTRFLNVACDTGLVQITGERSNKGFDTIERVTIDLDGFSSSKLSLDLQRIRGEYARLDRWTGLSNSEQLFYHYKTGNYVYVNEVKRVVTIYTKKYIEDIFNTLVKEVGDGDPLEVIKIDSVALELGDLYEQHREIKINGNGKIAAKLRKDDKSYNNLMNFFDKLQKSILKDYKEAKFLIVKFDERNPLDRYLDKEGWHTDKDSDLRWNKSFEKQKELWFR